MKILAIFAVVASLGLIGAAVSQAMPFTPAHPGGGTHVIRVIEGCGPNGHRGPGGACRPRYSCPRGWHSGPDGWHCFPNN